MGEPAREHPSTLAQRIKAHVEEVIAGSPLYVVEVVVRGRKGSQVVEVFVDSDEALNIEELARINRELGFLLDTENVIDSRYSLNVSSPGVQRPLKLPRQFGKNVGRKLRVQYRSEHGPASVEGELLAVEGGNLLIAENGSQVVTVAYDDVEEARVLLPW